MAKDENVIKLPLPEGLELKTVVQTLDQGLPPLVAEVLNYLEIRLIQEVNPKYRTEAAREIEKLLTVYARLKETERRREEKLMASYPY
ncbi:MAG: hypothetical protein ACPW60_07095 [Methylohalobius sp. ZOD2]